MPIWVHGLILVVLLSLVFMLVKTIQNTRKVERTSLRLEKLKEINRKYLFYDSIPKRFGLAISLPNKAKFDRYELTNLIDANIKCNEKFRQFLSEISRNITLYCNYKKNVDQLKSEMSEERAMKLHMPITTYRKIEQGLFLEMQKRPVVESKVECLAQYTTPKGRYTRTKTEVFTAQYCISRILTLSRLAVAQDTESARRKHERALMTDKMRYAILKRDGFRCKLCGRSADDGVRLHVDHIIPISKGGKTIESNLQVLCEDCNLGKSDALE